jgi:hypothetical protein
MHQRQPLPPPAAPDLAALDAVRPILAAEGKIAAIKAYREKTGTGLRDAKVVFSCEPPILAVQRVCWACCSPPRLGRLFALVG